MSTDSFLGTLYLTQVPHFFHSILVVLIWIGVTHSCSGAETPLCKAARDCNESALRLLLSEKADVNGKSDGNVTPLHYAASSECTNLAKLLLANKADVNARDSDGSTPLHWLATGGRPFEMAKLLVENNADVNMKNNQGTTPLHAVAMREDHMSFAELLIAHKADVNAKDNDGATPLHIAVQWSHTSGVPWTNTSVVEVLLASGADPNAKDNKGATPLHWAMHSRVSEDVVKRFLANHVDVNVKDNKGRTPLHWAAEWGGREWAALLLANKADINAKDKDGATPLHLAAQIGSETNNLLLGWQLKQEMVDFLVANKAKINAKDIRDETAARLIRKRHAIQLASWGFTNFSTSFASDEMATLQRSIRSANHSYHLCRGNHGLMEGLLLGIGFNSPREAERVSSSPDTVSKPVGPPELYWLLLGFCCDGDVEAVKILLKHGADPDGRDWKAFVSKYGFAHRTSTPPIFQAAFVNHPEVVKTLIAAGADVNRSDGEPDRTALWAAGLDYNIEIVRYLLDHGVKLEVRASALKKAEEKLQYLVQQNEDWIKRGHPIVSNPDEQQKCRALIELLKSKAR